MTFPDKGWKLGSIDSLVQKIHIVTLEKPFTHSKHRVHMYKYLKYIVTDRMRV